MGICFKSNHNCDSIQLFFNLVNYFIKLNSKFGANILLTMQV